MNANQIDAPVTPTPKKGAEVQGGVAPAAETPPVVTPEPGQIDAGQAAWNKEKADLQAQLTQANAKAEEDIRKLKSSLQSSAAQRENELTRQLSESQQKMNELTLQSLPENERAKYQQQLREQAQNQLSQQNQQLRQQVATQDQQYQQLYNYINYYTQKLGVPMEKLDLSQGVTSVYQSGQRAVEEMIGEMRGTTPPPENKLPEKPEAPPIATNTKGVPVQGPTVSQVVKDRYSGDEEAYWRAVESGRQAPPTS